MIITFHLHLRLLPRSLLLIAKGTSHKIIETTKWWLLLKKNQRGFLAKELTQKLKLLVLFQIRTSFHLSIIHSFFKGISQLPGKHRLYPQLPCGISPHCMQGIISKHIFHDFSCGVLSFWRISFLFIDSANSLSTLTFFV